MTVLSRDEVPSALGAWSEGGSLGVHLWPEHAGEPSPRMRLIVGRGHVPSDQEQTSLRALTLALVPERVRVWTEPVQVRCDGQAWKELATRAQDDAERLLGLLGSVGGPAVVFVADLDQLTARLADLPTPARGLLEHVDGVRTALSVLSRSPIPLRLAARSLLRLRDLGVLMVGSTEPVERESVVSPEPIE